MHNPHTPRGVAIVAAGTSSNSGYRENAKDTLFGGGPQKAPNTPSRGVGGNSSMSGILSTPNAVPRQTSPPTTARGTGRGGLGSSAGRSSLDLGDEARPAAGQRVLRESQSTKSTLSMTSGELDDTPIRTGKGFSNSRNNQSTFQFAQHTTPAPQARPQTASTGAKNRGTFNIAEATPAAPEDMHAAGQAPPQSARGKARPATAAAHAGSRSDIFFTGTNVHVAPAVARDAGNHSQKAHIAPSASSSQSTSQPETDGLPNLGYKTSRKNQESANLFIGGSAVARQVPDSELYGRSGSSAYASPPATNGVSKIPQLRLPADGNHSASALASLALANAPVAGLTSRDRYSEDPLATGNNTRRAYGNAKNASSLFQSDTMLQLQPKQVNPQLPEQPEKMKAHLKIIRAPQNSKESSVKNLLVWS